MKLIVLISCMHEKDYSIIERSNVQTDVVVVNQCDKDSIDEFDFKNKKGETCHAKFINTTERGLSRSRNMALRNAWGDVCLIADDDEFFEDDIEDKILNAYKENPLFGVITFALNILYKEVSYPFEKKKLGLKDILKTSSLQITFKRKCLNDVSVKFDEKMGSGTGNGSGEENRFLLDCRKANIKMIYIPQIIASIDKTGSQWFKGYTAKFFRDRGWTSRRNLGFFLGLFFVWYNAVSHRKLYTKDGLNLFKILLNMHKGFLEKR